MKLRLTILLLSVALAAFCGHPAKPGGGAAAAGEGNSPGTGGNLPTTEPAASRSSPIKSLNDETYTLADLRGQDGDLFTVRRSDLTVIVSFFSAGNMKCIQDCFIYRDGRRGMLRFVLDWAVQGGGDGDSRPGVSMPVTQRSELDAAIGRLPPDQPFAHDADALLVSWEENGKWRTRSYDRTRLPPGVLKLCNLVGIPSTWF
jgi:hypothetical protein